jgi:hypothetical protein
VIIIIIITISIYTVLSVSGLLAVDSALQSAFVFLLGTYIT